MQEVDARPDEGALATLAKVAQTVMARAAPVRFIVAQTEAQREAVYRLRYATVIERGWAQPTDYPDGMERDEYDAVALHILGLDGEALVACARMVFPSAVQLLPTERAFDMCIEPCGQVADMGRQIVARAYTTSRHVIFAGLLAKCWLEAQARGYYHVCGDFTPAMIRLYKHLGLEVKPLGPARLYWHEERLPILMDVVAATNVLAAHWLKP
jgi:N-acyl-L-homoserine lactone synthetase